MPLLVFFRVPWPLVGHAYLYNGYYIFGNIKTKVPNGKGLFGPAGLFPV